MYYLSNMIVSALMDGAGLNLVRMCAQSQSTMLPAARHPLQVRLLFTAIAEGAFFEFSSRGSVAIRVLRRHSHSNESRE